jgi:hypothetical protein
MTYRVTFDYGDIEVTVMQKSNSSDENAIQEKAIQTIINRDFSLPPEQAIVTIEPAPEWEEK